MTPFQQTFLMIFVPGVLLGIGLSILAGSMKSFWWRIPVFFLAVILLWGSLAVGVAKGYDAWQSMPDPPDEAFADGADLTGSVLFGWMPSLVVCTVTFLFTRLAVSIAQRRREA